MPSPSKTHGPIVKTGPTAGQVRARNKNGRWRHVRSDAGKPRAIVGGILELLMVIISSKFNL
jgi:hypothetical protein